MSALLEPGRVSSSKGEGARRATPDKMMVDVGRPPDDRRDSSRRSGEGVGVGVATAIRVTARSPPVRRSKQQSDQAEDDAEKEQVDAVQGRQIVIALDHADFSHLSPACSASRASSARDRREESVQAAKVQATSVMVSAAQTAQKANSITTAITSGVLRPWIP